MPQLLTDLRSLVLVLSFQVLAGFGAAAQPLDPNQLRAAQEFVADRQGLLAPTQVFGLQADLFCRSYYVELRRDADWGPNHPNWERGRAQFCAELIGIALPQGLSLEAYLASELAKELSHSELSQLNERNSEPGVVAAAARLQEQGFGWHFFVQAERPPGTAGLYSSAERESARRTVQILRR